MHILPEGAAPPLSVKDLEGQRAPNLKLVVGYPPAHPRSFLSLNARRNHRKAVFVCSAGLLIEGIMSVSVEICSSPKNEKKHRTMF